MKIGTTNLANNGFGSSIRKEKWFSIKPNESNLYRVLPPLFSLAENGQYSKYHAVHKIFLKNSDGTNSVYSFSCIQRKNRETKLIDVHCPFCDQHAEAERQYAVAKEKNASKELLQEFLVKKVLPYAAEKKFYINAVSVDNKVSILALPIKAHDALKNRLQDIFDTYGMDATGAKGLFLNFKKNQKFKGDRDTTYTVDKAEEAVTNPDGSLSSRLKMHELTPEFISYLEKSARDLSSLFKTISAEEMAMILAASPENKKSVLDKIFSNSEKADDQMDVEEVQIPGTKSTEVTSLKMTSQGIQAQNLGLVSNMKPQTESKNLNTPPWETAQPAQTTPNNLASMSDDEFMKVFGSN